MRFGTKLGTLFSELLSEEDGRSRRLDYNVFCILSKNNVFDIIVEPNFLPVLNHHLKLLFGKDGTKRRLSSREDCH